MIALIAGKLRPWNAARFATTSRNARTSVGHAAGSYFKVMAPRALAQYMYAMALLMRTQTLTANGWRPAQTLMFAGMTFDAAWQSRSALTLNARSGDTQNRVHLQVAWMMGVPYYTVTSYEAKGPDGQKAKDLLDLVIAATYVVMWFHAVTDVAKDVKTRVFLDVDRSGKFLKPSFNDRDPRTTLGRRLVAAISKMPSSRGEQHATVPISPEAGSIEIMRFQLGNTVSYLFLGLPKENWSVTLKLAMDGTGGVARHHQENEIKTVEDAQYATVIQEVATLLAKAPARPPNNQLAQTRAAATIQAAWKAHRTRQAKLRANSARPGYHLVAGKGAPFEVLRGPAGNRRTVAQKAEAARRHPTVARFNPRTNRRRGNANGSNVRDW